jgi:hypothetical protein
MASAPRSAQEAYVKTLFPDEPALDGASERVSVEPSETDGTKAEGVIAPEGLGALIIRSLGWIGAARTVSAVGVSPSVHDLRAPFETLGIWHTAAAAVASAVFPLPLMLKLLRHARADHE